MKILQRFFLIAGILLTVMYSCKQHAGEPVKLLKVVKLLPSDTIRPVDTTLIAAFFVRHSEFQPYQNQVSQLYRKYNRYLWYKDNTLTEFAQVLFNQAGEMGNEGLRQELPYRLEFDEIFYKNKASGVLLDSELLISCLYFYYIKNVYEGIDSVKSTQLEWFLHRDNVSYDTLLDSMLLKPGLINKERPEFFSQYYNLRKALLRLKAIEKNGGWNSIDVDPKKTSYKKGDSALAVSQIRTRLFTEGYLVANSQSMIFDDVFAEGFSKYQIRHNREGDLIITKDLITELNIPVASRIKTISVNMERCRWITPNLIKAKEFIAVNIPSFRLHYIRNGQRILTSKVVVGRELNKTVVFNGEMSYIVFSPYWNVPNSILHKEILPAIKFNANYLSHHNMEWFDGRVRQKPGKNNSLGLVKFMFPNSNNIYLHDTPAKSLFSKEQRAFSHGCIRVEKARELAAAIMLKDANWSQEKVSLQMDGKKERTVVLKEKIPVYIAYFTAWADEEGNVAFFNDIYNRDSELAAMLRL